MDRLGALDTSEHEKDNRNNYTEEEVRKITITVVFLFLNICLP